jgi:hypothetical protein
MGKSPVLRPNTRRPTADMPTIAEELTASEQPLKRNQRNPSKDQARTRFLMQVEAKAHIIARFQNG